MIDFNSALNQFFAGKLDFNGLLGALDLKLSEDPDCSPQIHKLLEDLLRQDRLPIQIYLALKERVRGAEHAAIPGDFEQQSQGEESGAAVAADLRTRMAPKSAHPQGAARAPDSGHETYSSTTADPPSGNIAYPQIPQVGTVLKGRFVLEEEVGRGGMGAVYKSRDMRKEEARDRDPFVAVKVLNEDFRGNPEAFIALQRETKKAQRLAHPNIATVYDFDRDGDLVFMTMELLEGESVERLVKRVSSIGLPLQEALPIVEGMVRGLEYAHERQIVHADFKPGNAFITSEGAVKVLDFGIARAVKRPGETAQDATVFDPGQWEALTPAYASCEMFDQATPDPRDDVYALACVTYELLAGRHPFNKLPANQARNRKLEPEPIRALSQKQNQALRRGLAFNRNERTASADELLNELKGGAGAGVSRWVWIGALGLTAVLIGGGVYYFFQLPADDPPVIKVAPITTPQVVAPVVIKEVPITSPQVVAPVVIKKMPITTPVVVAPVEEKPTEAPLDPETKAKIERILEMADLHLAIGRLVEPEGSNAAEAYTGVLSFHSENERALAGLQQIATHYEQLARTSLDNGDQEKALSEIDAGLKAYPGHSVLMRLREKAEGGAKK
ncbi:MAG: protein kinase [Sedimenticola sp.]